MTGLYWQFDTVCVQISFSAVELARRIYSYFRYHKILLVGAGEASKLVAKHFQDSGAIHFTVANRGKERRKALAEKVGGTPITLDYLPKTIVEADIIVVATRLIILMGIIAAVMKYLLSQIN